MFAISRINPFPKNNFRLPPQSRLPICYLASQSQKILFIPFSSNQLLIDGGPCFMCELGVIHFLPTMGSQCYEVY